MLSKRQESGENESSRRVKNEFLTELDGCTGKADDRVLVLAATNRPFDLDEGFMRRFPKRIFIDLPDNEARSHMIRRTFADEDTREDLTDVQLKYGGMEMVVLWEKIPFPIIQRVGR
jgi:SpoVK/Ycf46/Vps4 family AAA+-type ATPase